MSWVDKKAKYENISHAIDPSIKLVTKDSWFWKTLATLVAIATFGGISRKTFLEDYGTTIGPVQGYPRRLRFLSGPFLTHEARHTRQSRWFGLWIHPWVGLPIFALFYLLIPIPIGLAWFRFWFELDANRAEWRYMLQNGYSEASVLRDADDSAKRLCSGHYGWSWPKSWGLKKFQDSAKKVIEEYNEIKAKAGI